MIVALLAIVGFVGIGVWVAGILRDNLNMFAAGLVVMIVGFIAAAAWWSLTTDSDNRQRCAARGGQIVKNVCIDRSVIIEKRP